MYSSVRTDQFHRWDCPESVTSSVYASVTEVIDVQTLFDRRSDEALEANAKLYDVSDTGGGRGSVFDVQARLNMLWNHDR